MPDEKLPNPKGIAARERLIFALDVPSADGAGARVEPRGQRRLLQDRLRALDEQPRRGEGAPRPTSASTPVPRSGSF